MFGFGWVRTNLRVVFCDTFLVLRFLVGVKEKWMKRAKFGQVRGPTPQCREPHATA